MEFYITFVHSTFHVACQKEIGVFTQRKLKYGQAVCKEIGIIRRDWALKH